MDTRAIYENRRQPTRPTATHRDGGYMVLEMMLVLAIVGVLAGTAALFIGGLTTQAAQAGCLANGRQLHAAAEIYLVQTGTDQLPAAGTDHNRYEHTLAAADLIRNPSTTHDLDAEGNVTTQENSSCSTF